MGMEYEYLPSNPKYISKPLSIKQLPYMPSAAAYKIFTKRRRNVYGMWFMRNGRGMLAKGVQK